MRKMDVVDAGGRSIARRPSTPPRRFLFLHCGLYRLENSHRIPADMRRRLGGHQAALASPRWFFFVSGLSRLGGHQAALASPRWFFFAVGSLGFAWVFFIWFDQVFPELPAGFLGLDWVRVGFYWVFTRY